MRTLETRFSVPQSPNQVWSVPIDHPSYARWNGFMRETSAEVGVSKKLDIRVYLSTQGTSTLIRSRQCVRCSRYCRRQ